MEETEKTNKNDALKTININGTNNKYQMKKLLGNNIREKKQREETKKWNFSKEYFEYDKQLELINHIMNNNFIFKDDITKLVIQQINKKIYNYKQQDLLKKHYCEDKFILFEYIINKMIECNLKCVYCKKEMLVLYDISREMCQWTVDRIDYKYFK